MKETSKNLLTPFRPTTWDEIFRTWQASEGQLPSWQALARTKGWDNWEEWRRFSMAQIGAENRDWTEYTITNPWKELPAMLVGPFPGWQKFIPPDKQNHTTFRELFEIDEAYQFFSQHSGIQKMQEHFPSHTQLIGIRREDTNQIVCLEGHHRGAAVALAQKQEKTIHFGTVSIALSTLGANEIYLLDEMLKRGSGKET